jgi:hypothetical protein
MQGKFADGISMRRESKRIATEKGRRNLRSLGLTLLLITAFLLLLVMIPGFQTHFLLPVAFVLVVMATALLWMNTGKAFQSEKD